MRLIDADVLVPFSGVIPKECDADSFMRGMEEVLERLRNAPSIDIVLCSECRFRDDLYMHSEDLHRFEWCYEFNDVDGYCPFGKK